MLNNCTFVYRYDEKDLKYCETLLSTWITGQQTAGRKRRHAIKENKLNRILTPQQLVSYTESKVAREAVSILADILERQTVFEQDITKVRAHLMNMVCMENSQRAGVARNMTVEEWLNCKEVSDGDSCLVRVREHKTSATYGSAKVVIPKELHRHMSIWMDYIRPHLNKGDASCGYVLCSRDGNQLTSSAVSRDIKALWERVGVSDVTTTLIRTSIATHVRLCFK